jgi:hypothetical protein
MLDVVVNAEEVPSPFFMATVAQLDKEFQEPLPFPEEKSPGTYHSPSVTEVNPTNFIVISEPS